MLRRGAGRPPSRLQHGSASGLKVYGHVPLAVLSSDLANCTPSAPHILQLGCTVLRPAGAAPLTKCTVVRLSDPVRWVCAARLAAAACWCEHAQDPLQSHRNLSHWPGWLCFVADCVHEPRAAHASRRDLHAMPARFERSV